MGKKKSNEKQDEIKTEESASDLESQVGTESDDSSGGLAGESEASIASDLLSSVDGDGSDDSGDAAEDGATEQAVQVSEKPVEISSKKPIGKELPQDRFEKAKGHLADLAAFMRGKKEDDLHREHGFNLIHVYSLKELAEKDQAGKLHLSDGHCEMLSIQHARLKKAGKI